jgi:serine/threonine protein kinase
VRVGIDYKMDELYLEEMKDMKEQVSMNDFSMITLLGKGTYAKVVQVRCKVDGRIYAMKVIKKKHEMTKH